ncbi:MAG: hypothetical protein IJU33_07975 [Bacteroidales bacterium]|nr:hypothetical protein [Bacteroidales bacterium]
MNKVKNIVILGRNIPLKERSKAQMKGAAIGDMLSYHFYDGMFLGISLLFAEPKGDVASPLNLSITASNLTSLFNLPTVFILASCPAYERQRLIDKNVFFVVSEKYAHLPMLVANERVRKMKTAKSLTPVAQYLLLYHLQVKSLEGMAARDMEGLMPYTYTSITLGITCLADLGLCEKVADGSKRKEVHFHNVGKELWEQARPLLMNPVEQRIFCDEFLSEESFPICGINALAHYTRLNPDPERIIMMSAKQLREVKASGILVRPNEFDGNVIIEAWKYPPVEKMGENPQWVDKLSLAISLRDEDDPRIEGEVERLINEMEWKA